jgi:hypothetical protein
MARIIAGQQYVEFHGTEAQKAAARTTFFKQTGSQLFKETLLQRNIYNGYNPPVINPVMPLVAVPPSAQETVVPSLVPVNVPAINASVVAEAQASIAPLWSAGLQTILMLIMKLSLSFSQQRMAAVLTRNGVPQGIAFLVALMAPWLVEQLQFTLPNMVTVYRKRAKNALKAELIGRIGLDDWEKLKASMRVEERNLWRARSN